MSHLYRNCIVYELAHLYCKSLKTRIFYQNAEGEQFDEAFQAEQDRETDVENSQSCLEVIVHLMVLENTLRSFQKVWTSSLRVKRLLWDLLRCVHIGG